MLYAHVDGEMRQMIQGKVHAASDDKWYGRLKAIDLPATPRPIRLG